MPPHPRLRFAQQIDPIHGRPFALLNLNRAQPHTRLDDAPSGISLQYGNDLRKCFSLDTLILAVTFMRSRGECLITQHTEEAFPVKARHAFLKKFLGSGARSRYASGL